MKLCLNLLLPFWIIALALTSCREEPEVVYEPALERPDPAMLMATPLWQRHAESSLKILCIGNSFTHNATSYMPWLLERLNGDSICIGMLTRSGCSLKQHWTNHSDNVEDYEFMYSDGGKWVKCDYVKTFDLALMFFDWDIITLQQMSGWAGLYRTYQPYLSYLVKLFKETNRNALLAWHYTWAYTPWTEHPEFQNYDNNSQKMYEAIIEAGDKASEEFDMRLPSATLIKMLRDAFPEVENGFSTDGYHIVDDFADFALSALWYEVLVGARYGTSVFPADVLPEEVGKEGMDKVEDIISAILSQSAY